MTLENLRECIVPIAHILKQARAMEDNKTRGLFLLEKLRTIKALRLVLFHRNNTLRQQLKQVGTKCALWLLEDGPEEEWGYTFMAKLKRRDEENKQEETPGPGKLKLTIDLNDGTPFNCIPAYFTYGERDERVANLVFYKSPVLSKALDILRQAGVVFEK